MMKPDNVIIVPASLDGSFFKRWLDFLRPFHNLTNKEVDVLASFIKHRHELSKVVTDLDILDKVTMSNETRKKVMDDCNITQAHFQVIMTKLRKSNIIDNDRINSKYIPRINNESQFNLLISFNMNDK